MHIPDGFLDLTTIIVTYAGFIVYLVLSLSRVRRGDSILSQQKIPLVSALAAGIFAAQMLNWPIPGGTSLHFVGGALAGILLGPYLGFLAVFLVLLIQCLVFHDGGVTALGANVLNMAIIDVIIGYLCYKMAVSIFGDRRGARIAGAFIGGWLGITLAGIACGLEIGYSPTFPFGVTVTVPIMGSWHALLGIIEGIITAMVVEYLHSKLPIPIAVTSKR